MILIFAENKETEEESKHQQSTHMEAKDGMKSTWRQ